MALNRDPSIYRFYTIHITGAHRTDPTTPKGGVLWEASGQSGDAAAVEELLRREGEEPVDEARAWSLLGSEGPNADDKNSVSPLVYIYIHIYSHPEVEKIWAI